ncbi:ubiquitin-protein transferase [Aureococcus anophagefferens]|nr:ubiquitin-protein transferase [Aureococcus anophagefferens]
MVVLSFLVVVAVASSDDAPFDAALAAEGARGLAAARTARGARAAVARRARRGAARGLRAARPRRQRDAGAPRRPAAAALRRRRALRRALAGLRRGAPATPLLCAVSSLIRRGGARRWRSRLGHTSKALSLYALGVLGVADALLFLDSDAWVAGAAFGRPFLETFAAAARGGEVALPAPCYRQFFGAAVLLATATPWAVGFLARWFRLRSAPRKRPRISRNAKPPSLGRFG